MSHLAEIEVLLFVAGEEGLTLFALSELVSLAPSAVLQQLERLQEKYEQDNQSGLSLLESGQRYKLVTKSAYADLLRTYSKTPMNQSLSRALLETLSIVAYKQPITRVEIDDIRGVNSSGAVSKLQAFDLIRENGKKEVIGRPNLYVTTDYFLDYMGINSLEELPDVSDIDVVEEETALFGEGNLAPDTENEPTGLENREGDERDSENSFEENNEN